MNDDKEMYDEMEHHYRKDDQHTVLLQVKLTVIQIYSPMNDRSDEEKEASYEAL